MSTHLLPMFWRSRAAATELISPLSHEECARRLREAIDPPGKFFGRRPVVGSVNNDRFRGFKRIHYRNSFQTQVLAQLKPEGPRTRIACSFGLHPFVSAFFMIWMGIVLFVGGGSLVRVLAALVMDIDTTGAPEAPALAPLSLAEAGIPLAMLVFGLGLFGVGRWLARGERQYLIEFLSSTLQARVVSP